jgi:hypothetical protein
MSRWRTPLRRGVLAIALLAGCRIIISDDDFPSSGVTLDRAHATVTIRQSADSSQASVEAEITTAGGLPLVLSSQQAVQVNGTTLEAAVLGTYIATIAAADTYTVAVREPTRGVEQTAVAGPVGFTISEPAAGDGASLSGFTVAWSASNPQQQARLVLRQTVFGTQTVRRFGPVADAGSFAFGAADLRDFVQGATLEITVTRTAVQPDIAGFASGTATVEVSAAQVVDPRP